MFFDLLYESLDILNEKDDEATNSDKGAETSDDNSSNNTNDKNETPDPTDNGDDNKDTQDDTNKDDGDQPKDDEFDADSGKDDDFGFGDTDDTSDTNTDDGDSSTEEPNPEIDTTQETDDDQKTKKYLLAQNFLEIYNDISTIIKSFKQMSTESDEERDLVTRSIDNFIDIRTAVYEYIQFKFDKDDYETCLYKIQYFKDVMIVAKEIIQKIKELRKNK